MKRLGTILQGTYPASDALSDRSPERNQRAQTKRGDISAKDERGTVEVTDAKGRHLRLVKTQPKQYELFSSFLPDDRHVERYSNTIELYDAAPKYFVNKESMQRLRKAVVGENKKRFLDKLVRHFEHKGKQYNLMIQPARVEDKDGYDIEYYPSETEEFVEEALRKIACDDPSGAVYLNNNAGVQFTGYQLRQELKRQGHTMNWPDLWRSLQIGAGTRLTITSRGDDNEVHLSAPMFPVLAMTRRRQYEDDPKNARCYVEFNPLVTQSLNHLTYRQFDYATFMQLRRPLARWLLKRLSHNYVQASMMHPYTIKLSTIMRDSGLISPSRSIRHQMRDVDAALDELQKQRDDDPAVLQDYNKEMRKGKRGKIEEVTYTLMPHFDFISQAKKANRRQHNLLAKACEDGLTSQDNYDQFVKETRSD